MTRLRGALAIAFIVVLVPVAGWARTNAAGVIVFAADRKPTDSGEIYRVGLNGTRVNLSRSPAFDASPAVSTDGRSVAFLSTRGGHVALYTVGTNGRNLRRISPTLFPYVASQPWWWAVISWAPDSRHLAAFVSGVGSNLYLAAPGHSWRVVPHTHDALSDGAQWSPDGRFLAFTVAQAGEVRVIDATGKTRWTAPGLAFSWSARGRLAVQANSYTLAIYDETGHPVNSIPASLGAWSPNGDRLASLTPSRKMLEIRAGGVGRPTLRHPLSGDKLGWLGASTVRSFGANGWIGFDVVHARTFQLRGAYLPYSSVPYIDGTKAVAESYGSDHASLAVTALSGETRVVATATRCPEAGAFSNEQFLPGGRFVVYATSCPAPPGDIYSVSPDGTGLRRLTTLPFDDTQPALSPDGKTIAYVEKDNAVKCGGCTETTWLMNADGSSPHALPNASVAADTPYDDSPSFSPDGSQLLFVRGGPSSTELFAAPVAGGSARDLGVAAIRAVWGPQRIAYTAWPGGEWTTAAADGSDRRAAGFPADTTVALAWSPSGMLAGLEWRASKLSVVLGGKGSPIPLPGLAPDTTRGAGLAWSPDGSTLAFTAMARDGVGDLYTVRADGSQLMRVTHDLGALSSVSWR